MEDNNNDDNNLEMSLFNTDSPIELNLDGDIPSGLLQNDTNGDGGNTDPKETDPNAPANIPEPNEDEDPEDVVGKGDQKDDEGDDESSPNLYSSFAEVLNEQGLLPSFDLQNQKVETIDDLTNAFKSEIDTQVKNYLVTKLGEEGFDAIEKGVSLLEYQEHKDNIDVLDNITSENLSEDLELSKRIILQDYISQGISEKKALRLLRKTVELGEESILEDATESLESLKEIEAKRIEKVKEQNTQRAAQQKALEDKIDNDLKNAIYNKKEFIKNIPTNKAIQDKVYQSITKIVGKSPEGVLENKLMKDRRENPIEFDSKLYYLYELTNGFNDFSKLVGVSKTRAIDKLEESLRNNKFEDAGKPGFLTDPESYGGIGSELVID